MKYITVILLVSLIAVCDLVSTIEATADPVNITSAQQFRDIRSPNSVNFSVGDRHIIVINVDNPTGTTVRAMQGGFDLPLSQSADTPTQFSLSRPFGSLPTDAWQITAQNGPDMATFMTNVLPKVGRLPFVRNFRIVPNELTPTLLWDLPVGSTEPFNAVRVGFFDDRTNFRLRFPAGNLFESLSPTATSFTFPSGILEEGVPYVFRVFLSNSLAGIGTVNRGTTFKNFTPIMDIGGPSVFLPTVDSEGVFQFDLDVLAGQPVVIDPFIAIGYEYQIGVNDPKFASVTFPEVGDKLFTLSFLDANGVQTEEELTAGIEFVFPHGGVDQFVVTGIEPSAGLAPNDVTAFMTTLTFVADGAFTGSMTPITQFVSGDSDDDGIPNDGDICPNSDLRPTVIIDDCDSEVTNTLFRDESFGNGCTISDLIAQCAEGVSNHGQFASCAAHLTNDLKKAGIITGQEKGAIQSCAAQADIP